jgi:YidC/Oxa1 family membrane protein insertase
MRTSKKMQALTPHLSKVKEKHKGDAQKIQQETMRLYQEHGVNPAAGCIPLLVQLPVIWALYGVLQNIVKYTDVKQINESLYADFLKLPSLWDTHFFGLPLTKSPSQLIQSVGILILLIPIITGILQYFQSKILLPQPPRAEDKPKDKKEPSGAEDFAAAFQKQSLYLFPIMIGFFSWSLPVGLSLYWNTFSIFGIIQQRLLERGQKAVVPSVSNAPKKKKK